MYKFLNSKKILNLSFNNYLSNSKKILRIKKFDKKTYKYKRIYTNFNKKIIIHKNNNTSSINNYFPITNKILTVFFYFFLINFFSKFQLSFIDTYDFKNKFNLNNNYIFTNNVVQDNFFKIDILSLGLLSCVNSKIVLQFFLTQINSLKKEIQENGLKGKVKLENLNKLIVVLITFVGSILYFSFIWQFFNNIDEIILLTFISNFLFGSLFILWISDRINDLKIGQGLSILILYNLISNIENKLTRIKLVNSNYTATAYTLINIVLIIFAFGLILIQDSEKKLKIKYLQTKSNNSKLEILQKGKENKFSIIPIKINPSNVLSFILTYFLLQENFNEYLYKFFNEYHVFNKPLILTIKNISTFSIITIFNTVFGIQQINLSNIVKNIRKQNILVLGISNTKYLKKYIANYIFSTSILSSVILILLFNLIHYIEFYSNLKIIQGLTSNVIIIVSGITIDIAKRIYVDLTYTSYDNIKL
ncbi:thylakoid preprotein translocase (nucleomorph) [Lotharella oceanica]|uniref:Thylakoid preprotein translocase n=1 Tax=Lotharella oceanica TaxID=641309 RepID=A0A060DHH3_9EUKA|nr:thylakoid preprotein translocase [Lotharella oceanica]